LKRLEAELDAKNAELSQKERMIREKRAEPVTLV
jgi:hypothetical protein